MRKSYNPVKILHSLSGFRYGKTMFSATQCPIRHVYYALLSYFAYVYIDYF